jgi:cytochrome b6-f complex iron-sulfur subunit
MTDQTRREFCAQACQLASVATLATLVEACGGGGGGGNGTLPSDVPSLPTVSGNAANGVVSVAVDASSPLAAVGSAALVQSSSGLFLVAHTGQDTFTALTATCTHEACTIIGFTGSTYVCPCHGSRFSTSGGVQNGPATRSLRSFPTSVASGILQITA